VNEGQQFDPAGPPPLPGPPYLGEPTSVSVPPPHAQERLAPTKRRWVMPTVFGALALLVAVFVVIAAVLAVTADASTSSAEDHPSKTGGLGAAGNLDAVEISELVAVDRTSLPRYPNAGDDPAVGMKIPVLRSVNPQGEPVTTPAQGPALIVGLAHWCPHCQREVPVIMDVRNSKQWPSNVALVGISIFQNEDKGNYPPSEWLASEGWRDPILVDDADHHAANALGIRGTPTFVFVDAGGTVVYRSSGELPKRVVAGLVGQLAAGETPDPTRLPR